MNVKFYIKWNANNQIAKVKKSNMLFLNEHFISKINAIHLINILWQIEGNNLVDYFENLKFGMITLSAKIVKKCMLCTLYKVKCLSKEESYALIPIEKNLNSKCLRKPYCVYFCWINWKYWVFLKFCNIKCKELSTLVQLRDLSKLAVKTYRDVLDTEDKDNSNDSTADLTFTENKLLFRFK